MPSSPRLPSLAAITFFGALLLAGCTTAFVPTPIATEAKFTLSFYDNHAVDTPGRVLQRVAPRYPEALREAGIDE